MARNEKISSITLSDINKFENLIDTKGVAGTIEVYDNLQTKFGSGYAGWAKGVAAGNNTTGQEALAYLKSSYEKKHPGKEISKAKINQIRIDMAKGYLAALERQYHGW